MRDHAGGVNFEGPLATGYKVLLESRLASRVLLEVASGPVVDTDDLYALARGVDWRQHMDPNGTLACEFTGNHPAITNTHFGALKLKDAICDQLRDTTKLRPSIETQRPDVSVHAHAQRGQVSLSIDLAGDALSRRGYRLAGGEAPLRENIAAGILMRAGWPAIAAAGGEFLDPMCGSGTFVIEAAWMATDTAPGLLRDFWGFRGWRGHDAALWDELVVAASARMKQQPSVVIRGSDRNRAAIATAQANARRAGVGRDLVFEHCDIGTLAPRNAAADAPPGLLCVNPPYGLRIGRGGCRGERIAPSARRCGVRSLRGTQSCSPANRSWASSSAARPRACTRCGTAPSNAGCCDSHPASARCGAKSRGVIIDDSALRSHRARRCSPTACARTCAPGQGRAAASRWVAGGSMTRTCRSTRWRWTSTPAQVPTKASAGCTCRNTRRPPRLIRRRRAAGGKKRCRCCPKSPAFALADIRLRTRRRQKAVASTRRSNRREEFHVVEEAGFKVRVNLDDYLDTGLFLDHRLTRQRLGALRRGKRFLNLFCYTGVATLHAVAGGAAQFAQRGHVAHLPGLGARPTSSSMAWLRPRTGCCRPTACAGWRNSQTGLAFDLIFLDPPTFSNSARMEGVLDTQRDHAGLIRDCMRLLAPEGLLVFSTNAQRFALDPDIHSAFRVADISAGDAAVRLPGQPADPSLLRDPASLMPAVSRSYAPAELRRGASVLSFKSNDSDGHHGQSEIER